MNRIHASGRTVDFLVHTGDACDNAQSNELGWFLDLLDGKTVNPLSGPDDRPADARPATDLDPYAAFDAQGLYQTGRHGDLPSIPWYTLFGNHDVYAIGIFPIFEDAAGRRTAPLPLPGRPGWVLPVILDPTASVAYGNVTPAAPGPPRLFNTPLPVVPNPARAYFSQPEYIQALFETTTQPPGSAKLNFALLQPADARGWTSVQPVAGLRLIRLDTTDRAQKIPGAFYDQGALSRAQLTWLRSELEAAAASGDLVIVASHHPSASLSSLQGSAVTPDELRELLNQYPSVVLHVAGHTHRTRVTDRSGYIEIETCSTLDLPQEGRLFEIWRNPADASVLVTYEMFSHLDDTLPPLGDDPLRSLREQARAIALGDQGAAARQKLRDPSGADPYGAPSDRKGAARLSR